MTQTELDRANAWIDAHRPVLREAAQHWVETGEWLTVTQLGRSALRREDTTDVFAALRALPPALGRVDSPGDNVILRVRGLVVAPEAQGVVHEFIRALWLAVTRLRSEDVEPKLRRSDLLGSLGHDDVMADRVGELVLQDSWMFGGGSGIPDGEWERSIGEHTRAVATVKSVDDYLAVEGQRFWSKPQRRGRSPAFGGRRPPLSRHLRRRPPRCPRQQLDPSRSASMTSIHASRTQPANSSATGTSMRTSSRLH